MGWSRFFRRSHWDNERAKELQDYLGHEIDDNLARGLTPDEARRAAHRKLGSPTRIREEIYEMNGLPWLDSIGQDLRYAWRGLRRNRTFTAVAVLTLALGIGANTVIFSIVSGVLLRPLPYGKPEQLMHLSTQEPALGFKHFQVSVPEYLEFRAWNQSFAAVGAYRTDNANLTAGDQALRVRSAFVDEHLLNALGFQAAQGRLFGPGETDASGPLSPPIVILSHELWQRAFGGQPILDQSIEVNGRRRKVIGIMPPDADVMDNHTEVWLPLGLNPANRRNRGNHNYYLVGRLKTGVSQRTAQTELDGLLQNWGERAGVTEHVFSPLGAAGVSATSTWDAGHILQMEPMRDAVLGSVTRSVWVLQAAVSLVLLIACINLANLLLARAEGRRRELAVRTALGASRRQLLRQFVTEGLLLSIAGGAVGVLWARAGIEMLLRAYPTSLPRTGEVQLDVAGLLFTLGVSMVTGVILGLAPIMHCRVAGLARALRESGSKGASAAAGHFVRRALVAGEVALAVMLVIGAGLLVRTVQNLASVDVGFDRSRLVTFSITLPQAAYADAAARARMFGKLLDGLRAVPGVQKGTAMSGLPPNRSINADVVDIDDYTAPPGGPFETVDYDQEIMSGYFDTMGIPIVRGRSFQPADAASPAPLAVVNEAFVNRFWKGLDPIGRRLRPCCGNEVPWITVIGVAKDVKQGGLDQKAGTERYLFIEQAASVPPSFGFVPNTVNVVLRTTLTPAALSKTVQEVTREIDRAVPVVRLREMERVLAESIERPRLLAQLVSAFAGLALLLAAIGTYGVLSYLVAARRREIGIRMALGAERSSVLVQVMKEGLQLAAIGVGIGLAGAFALNRALTSLLFGVQPSDVPTQAAVVTTIMLVAALACGLPAWRASRLDPNVVLRDD